MASVTAAKTSGSADVSESQLQQGNTPTKRTEPTAVVGTAFLFAVQCRAPWWFYFCIPCGFIIDLTLAPLPIPTAFAWTSSMASSWLIRSRKSSFVFIWSLTCCNR